MSFGLTSGFLNSGPVLLLHDIAHYLGAGRVRAPKAGGGGTEGHAEEGEHPVVGGKRIQRGTGICRDSRGWRRTTRRGGETDDTIV